MANRSATNTTARVRRPAGRWLRTLLLGLLALALLVPILGAGFQVAAEAADARRFPPPGQLVDVGGYRVHLHVMGAEHTTGPTIILEAGAMSASPQWFRIQPALAERYRVVAYDRPGMGWSDAAPEPFSPARAATALHTALERAGIAGPYILVGHSLGGIFVRVFAGQYPDDVAGVVLIDPSHPEQGTRMGPSNDLAAAGRSMAPMPWLARVGGMRVIDLTDGMLAGMPEQHAGALRSFYASTRHLETSAAEMAGADELGQAAVAAGELGDRPVIVLSAGALPSGAGGDDPAAHLATWHALHAELVALSTRGEQRIVTGAEHITIVTNPTHSAAVIAAVDEVAAGLGAR
jgi:pimeloyl-ACP methyl ester carboxylesterase